MSEKVFYQKFILKGTHYDIGRQIGDALLEHDKPSIEILTSPYELPNGEKMPEMTLAEAEGRCNLLNQLDPGLGDELMGFANSLGIPVNKLNMLLYCGLGVKKPCSCSLFGIDGCMTADGHTYMGQSYEYSLHDEFSYKITQAEGSYSHMGFSLFELGRYDGINEKGVCIGITSLEVVQSSVGEKGGFSFPFLVRILLDTCATTQEALAKLKTLPICTNANIMIGDKTGSIVLAEIQTVDGKSDIIERHADPYVYGFNHFLDKAHKERLPQKRYFSYAREQFMEQFFLDTTICNAEITTSDIERILKTKVPNGLCCHAYSDYFGTLRSIIYDVTDSTVSIALGSPQNVDYIKLSLEKELNADTLFSLIPVEYEDEPEEMKFWSLV